MAVMKLTKRAVEGATAGTYFDTDIPGFGVRVDPTGSRTYFIKLKVRDGAQRKPTIGRHGIITCDQARERARDLYIRARDGFDPMAERYANATAATVSELCDRYLLEHSDIKKKFRSARGDHDTVRTKIKPVIGKMKVKDVTRADIAKFHHNLNKTPVGANRTIALLSHIFKMAELWGMRSSGTNPAKGIQKFREQARERYLNKEEMARLSSSLDKFQNRYPYVCWLVRLLLFTGARRNEIMTIKWEYIDDHGRAHLPDSKTGKKLLILSAPALKLLAAIPRVDGNPYVIPGRKKGTCMKEPKYQWAEIRKDADLDGVRLHDLRHTFASTAVSTGASLPIIGKLLGHRQAGTTQRYAHLAHDPLKVEADRVAGLLDSMLQKSVRRHGRFRIAFRGSGFDCRTDGMGNMGS